MLPETQIVTPHPVWRIQSTFGLNHHLEMMRLEKRNFTKGLIPPIMFQIKHFVKILEML